MSHMLQGGCLSVFEAKTRDEFCLELVHFAKQLGFDTISATTVLDHFLGEPEFISVDNTPAGYQAHFADESKNKRDPVLQHCKTKSVPIIWSQSTYVNANTSEIWETQAQFGYRHGIAFALHLPQGRHFMLGIDRDQALPDDPAEIARLTSSLVMFTVHAQDVAMRVLTPSSHEPECQALTARELETLRWTMEGKTAWEVGRILGIAEDTVVRHAHSATRKLGCTSKLHAVVKALRLGLIE